MAVMQMVVMQMVVMQMVVMQMVVMRMAALGLLRQQRPAARDGSLLLAALLPPSRFAVDHHGRFGGVRFQPRLRAGWKQIESFRFAVAAYPNG